MKVKYIDLRFDMGKRIKITKIINPDFKHVVGQTGEISNPFGKFHINDIGVFLDMPFNNCDTINLHGNDEIEYLDEN